MPNIIQPSNFDVLSSVKKSENNENSITRNSYNTESSLKDISSLSSTSSFGTHKSSNAFVKIIQKCYFNWAKIVTKYSIAIIIICLVLTGIGTAKIIVTKNVNDITGYTPYGARSRYEMKVSQEFSDEYGRGPMVFLSIVSKDGGNMMRPWLLKEAVKVHQLVMNNFTIYNKATGFNESYKTFCHGFCNINEPLVQFYNGYKFQYDLTKKNETLSDRIILQYPKSQFYGRDFGLQSNFFGVKLKKKDELSKNDITNLEYTKMIGMFYIAKFKKEWTEEDVKDFELQFIKYFTKEYKSKFIRVLPLSTTYVELEVVRAGMANVPYLSLGFTIMVICSCTTVLISSYYMNQVSIHKISLAFNACVCPFMACGTALGTLFFCGVRFGSVLCVTPFLVLAIGVDDAYLMIHSWQKICKEMRRKNDPNDSVEKRLGLVLQETGPAILISACTNILADYIGTFTGSPEITLLCVGNMSAIFVDFIYQITFYCAIISIVGKYEMINERSLSNKLSISIGDIAQNCKVVKVGPVKSIEKQSKNNKIFRKFVKKVINGYINILTNIWFNILVIIGWITFLIFCAYGITNIKILLNSEKLFAMDSPLIEINQLRENVLIRDCTQASVYVTTSIDFSNQQKYNNFMKFVREFESDPLSLGSESTHLFLKDFLEFEKHKVEWDNDEENIENNSTTNIIPYVEKDIIEFLKWPEEEHWNGFVKLSNNNTKLKSFFFNIYYHGETLSDWVERGKLMDRLRSIVDKYKKSFNATVFMHDGIYFDLIDNMPRDAIESSIATIICMGLICSMFMFRFKPVVIAMLTIGSIIILMLGSLYWTGTTLDPVIMASILISIGFSVDIPAHVIYHFHVSQSNQIANNNDKNKVKIILKEVITSVGFPAFQAALSTSLCISVLLLVNVYMSRAFVKVMVICLSLCLYHGLLIIPTIYALINHLQRLISKQ
ncbi:Sterol-sensing domain and Patched family-containing protein [Strongyloides ratti]|uniref:Sterol-sensing domain and Patched family-containing protein n=1 Tax=Strongyloides ratti TaxID=34506 RepID=A0A090LIU4_STRRB|nr:Sterol-sensing domain and Patched family-containing protein [Strongyloides ratti]CEF68053.1 Sterol-sensing domain and Patched family-containing protein [Strongyloides ratti]